MSDGWFLRTSGGSDFRLGGPAPSRPAWFDRWVLLMVHGDGGEDRVRGVVRARTDDDGGTEFHYRVARRGVQYRCESLDGRIHAIRGDDGFWSRGDGNAGPSFRPARWGFALVQPPFRPPGPPDDYQFGTARPDADRWEGEDFTRPTGPARPVSFLGRPAYEIELAPPPHKPWPIQIVIDADTGLLLRSANAALDTSFEWIELDTDAHLPDALFAWNETDQFAERYR
jgi:hypothetical protein